MTAPVWIDTDLGADDLFAILLVAAHRPMAGLSLSFGCSALDQGIRNARGAADLFGWPFPVTRGAARPILGPVETAERILGPLGYKTRGARLPADPLPDLAPALPAMAAHLEQGGAMLALGPLTNLATLALARPDLKWPLVTWMGGSTGRGNHTPAAEFNALADPEALAVLLDRGVGLRMIDLEVCRKVLIAEQDVTGLRASGGGHAPLLADLLGGYLDIALTRGREAMALYDPVAAAALIQPDLFRFEAVDLAVDVTRGPERGRTTANRNPDGTSQIVDELDVDTVRDVCLQALETAPCPMQS